MEEKKNNVMRWSVCPASSHPWKRCVVWLIIVVLGILIIGTNPLLGVCLIAVFIASLSTFLFPSRFCIDSDGLTAKYPVRKKYYKWSNVRRATFFEDACYLFSRKKPSNLDGFSGIAVFYGKEKDEIERVIKSHLPPEVMG